MNEEKKSIAVICLNLAAPGGIERVSINLSNALLNYYKIHLISICSCSEPVYMINHGVAYKSFNESLDKIPKLRKRVANRIKSFLEDNHISVAILQGGVVGYIFSGISLSGIKTVFCDHGSIMGEWNNKKAIYMLFRASLSGNKTVCLTKRNLQDYIKIFHTRSTKLTCIPNWIEPEVFDSKSYNYQSQKIISVGRLSYEKGFDNLIKAFFKVHAVYPSWSLDIYGDGPERKKLEALIADNKLSGVVTLCGNVSDIHKCYKEYAFFVLPSEREGLPMVLLEAKANLLPCISYDIVAGPREIIADKIDGLLVSPRDIEPLSQAILSLVEHPEERIHMSNHSQKNIDCFLKESVLNKWLSLIDSL